MKIAIVNQPLGKMNIPWTGKGNSLEIWIYEVSSRLVQFSDVIVYTKRFFPQKKDEYYNGVHYRRIGSIFDEWFNFIKIVVDEFGRYLGLHNAARFFFYRNIKRPFFASRFYYLTYAWKIARDLRKEKCDVVHIINFSQFIPIIRAFNPKIKIVIRMSCEWLTQLEHNMIEKRLREVDLIIGSSEYITNKIKYNFPEFSSRTKTVYSGVDINHFIVKKGKKNKFKKILFVGRISPEKGLHVLLEAFNRVVEQCPSTRLEIVGPIIQLPFEYIVALCDDFHISNLKKFYEGNSLIGYFLYLKNQLILKKIANNVTFTGRVPHTKIVNYYVNSDVLVNPSFSESFGMTLIEAMACQLPVVATRIGGMTEIVENGKTGILVEPDDAERLAEAILYLVSNEDLRKLMGKAARKRVIGLFSWEKSTEKLLYLYKNICEHND